MGGCREIILVHVSLQDVMRLAIAAAAAEVIVITTATMGATTAITVTTEATGTETEVIVIATATTDATPAITVTTEATGTKTVTGTMTVTGIATGTATGKIRGLAHARVIGETIAEAERTRESLGMTLIMRRRKVGTEKRTRKGIDGLQQAALQKSRHIRKHMTSHADKQLVNGIVSSNGRHNLNNPFSSGDKALPNGDF